MTMGAETDARATLEALIDAAAPGPVPADQALPLLRRVPGTDVVALARLAYHALTGVDPGDAPRPATEVRPGFPVFAGEVLMRALEGPDDRRPTPQALLVVLETVPASAWPAREDRSKPEPDPVTEHEATRPPATADATHADFRGIVGPPRAVPRFEPLEGAGQVPGLSEDPARAHRSGRRRRRRKPTRSYGADRRQTLVMVALLVALIAIGVVYTAFRSADQPEDSGAPQGAPVASVRAPAAG